MVWAALMLCCASLSAQAEGLQQLWSVDVDQRRPNDPLALSAPAVARMDGQDVIVVGGRDGWVHVYGMDGEDIRRIKVQAPVDSGALALPNGLVALVDTRGMLYGIDIAQGMVRWQTQLTAGVTSTPVAIGDDFLLQTTDNRIYRFSANGEKQWSFAGQNNTLSMYFTAHPLVRQGRVYVLLNNGNAVALDATTGDVLWKKQLLLVLDSAALSDLEVALAAPVYVSHVKLEGEQNDRVLLMPFFQGELKVVVEQDGTQLLSLPVSLASSPLLLGNILFMADSEGMMQAYDVASGKRLWRKKISDAGLLGPVLWQEQLWVADSEGKVFAVDKAGQVRASLVLECNISRAPLPTAQGLLLRTERGEMSMVALHGAH